MVQIVQANNKPEPVAQLPSFYAPPSYPQASYNPYQTPAPRSRIPKPHMSKKKSSRKQAQPVNRTPSPYYNHLQSLFSAIPPVYDDVNVNVNYAGKNKRKRRSAPGATAYSGEAPAKTAAYEKWYNTVYLPWYQNYAYQMQKYYQQLKAYEAAMAIQSIPSNPFGSTQSFGTGNKFYEYSKQAYNQHLYEQVKDTDPTLTHAEAFAKWVCERESTRNADPLFIDAGQDCYLDATPTEAGQCITAGADGAGACVEI
eukprot:TRINITY_DN351_c0_g2_i3.p1 TRINITY_DN351_c0_g2~~TRINITY_DN351_c0_g2_i3.p1  ORF type:complete len:255 (-),score=68.63 TRINITY_DN351_c0_g2_i3:42-806(-)